MASAELFLPWANAMLIEQVDIELPVNWTLMAQKCSSVKSMALELIKFFDANIHWKHRALYEALTVIAGLKTVESKDLNSLDLRIRTEWFLEMKLTGDDWDLKRRESRLARKLAKLTERVNNVEIEEKTTEMDEYTKEKKRRRKSKKKRDHEKAERESKRKSKHNEGIQQNGNIPTQGESDRRQGRRNKTIKKDKTNNDGQNEKEKVTTNGKVSTDSPTKEKRNKKDRKSKTKSQIDEVTPTIEVKKHSSDNELEMNNNSILRVKNSESDENNNKIKHRSSFTALPVEEWDPNSEEYLV